METFGQVVRNLVVFIMCVVALAAFVFMNVLLLPTNYLATGFSFYLLGYDGMPAGADVLIGPYMDGFFENASITNFFAIGLTIACFLGLFVAFHSLFHILKLLDDRKVFLLQSDPESASIATRMLLKEAFLLFVLWVPPLIWILHWDLELFRLRSVAGALALEDPAVASQLANWEEQIKENSLIWAWPLTKIGAWSYLAMTAVGCLGMEYTLMKLSNAWTRLLASVQSMILADETRAPEKGFYGYDQDGQPVDDPNTPTAYDVDGQPLAYEEVAPASPQLQERPVPNQTETASVQSAALPLVQEANGYHQDSPPSGPNETPIWDAAEVETGTTDTEATEADRENSVRSETLYDVIGGAAGEKVTLKQALANERRYWVDREGPHVWDTQYREALFGEELKKAA